MNAIRLPDWQLRLQALIAERLMEPFAWGAHDCCTFACDAVVAITGRDPAEGLRDHSSAKQAALVLAQHGGVQALGDARLGPRVPILMAQVGDIGLLTLDDRESLAVCGGGHWLAPGLAGLVCLPLSAAVAVWRGVCPQ